MSVLSPSGVLHLVGAGPGDPELLTVRAVRLIGAADVVVYDRLVDPRVLELAAPRAELIPVGKARGHHSVPQDQICALIVARALAGQNVVRLKGGDPFVFGRGGEEVEAARAAGVEVHVTPGVTAALASAAAAGAPLTHRDHVEAATFVTGATRDGPNDISPALLGAKRHTLAVYMGLDVAPRFAARMLAAGRGAETPVLIVQEASRLTERRFLTTLGQLSGVLPGLKLDAPVMFLIGESMALADAEPILIANENAA